MLTHRHLLFLLEFHVNANIWLSDRTKGRKVVTKSFIDVVSLELEEKGVTRNTDE